jgi:hypothetical protein
LLKKSVQNIESIRNRKKFNIDEPIDYFELNEFKKQRLLDKAFWELVKEITLFSFFLCFLFMVAYSNISTSAFHFNQLFQHTVAIKQSNLEIGLNNVNLFVTDSSITRF